MPRTHVCADADVLAREVARYFGELAREAIADRSRFTVALSGGTSPLATFGRLAQGAAGTLDWAKVFVFWCDERCVPPDHADSNYGAAKRLLLDPVRVPAANIHRMQGELEPALAADRYEESLREYFADTADGVPQLDLALLGLGMDGHTASLFPETIVATVLAPENRGRWVLPVHLRSRASWRITLTPPVINAARHIAFIATGGDKAVVVHDVLQGATHPETLPAQLIAPLKGDLTWFLDRAAACELQGDQES